MRGKSGPHRAMVLDNV